jgi:hypothetical protein
MLTDGVAAAAAAAGSAAMTPAATAIANVERRVRRWDFLLIHPPQVQCIGSAHITPR